MRLTAPQKRILLENHAPELDDYKRAISRRSGGLEHYLELAKKAGFATPELKALLGYALKNKIIDMPQFNYMARKIDLAKDRKVKKTGRIDPRETAIKDDDDDSMSVKCVSCKNNVDASQASLSGAGWICNQCR